jgi:hypothetical protein
MAYRYHFDMITGLSIWPAFELQNKQNFIYLAINVITLCYKKLVWKYIYSMVQCTKEFKSRSKYIPTVKMFAVFAGYLHTPWAHSHCFSENWHLAFNSPALREERISVFPHDSWLAG